MGASPRKTAAGSKRKAQVPEPARNRSTAPTIGDDKHSRKLVVVERTLDTLVPYARNARTHSDEQIAEIAASINTFGFTNPVLIAEDGTLIAGHGRVLAARRLGRTSVPTITVTGLSETERRALVLADNRIAQNAGWDEALLALELQDLNAAGFELDLLGFEARELNRLLEPSVEQQADEDLVPDPPLLPVTAPGDLWLLGSHRLLCGDATSAADVARLLGGAKPKLMVTDPPYGVDYDPAWRNESGVSATKRTGKVANDGQADWREAWALFPGDVAYVWHAGTKAVIVAESLMAVGFEIRAQIIWRKNRFALSRGDYHWQHEPCWYAVRKGAGSGWQGARDQSSVWDIAHAQGIEDAATVHGTQKPVEAMRRAIVNNARPGEAVYEPFAGSGTTLIAGETTKRPVLALELDPLYCDVIVERWQRFTGQAATNEEGVAFDDLKLKPAA
jgi:DNA modification methylase